MAYELILERKGKRIVEKITTNVKWLIATFVNLVQLLKINTNYRAKQVRPIFESFKILPI